MWGVLPLMVAWAASHGFGIDWGTEFHKSSMLVPGQHFRAVENELSKRKTHNFFVICGEERFFDAQAAAKLSRKACEGFFLASRLLHAGDIDAATRMVAADERYIAPLQLRADEAGLAFALQSPAFLAGLNITRAELPDGTRDYLRQEEVIAMVMEKNLVNAGNTVNSSFTAGVLSLWSSAVPVRVRRVLRSAFALAGLRLEAVVQENVAAAIYDSLGREGESPEQHLYLLNLGSSGARLSVVTYASVQETWADNTTHWVPTVTPREHVWTQDFSGHALDVCFADTVLAATGKTASAEKTRELYQEIRRVKEVLSANRAMQMLMEDFFGQSSLAVKATREMFESGCAQTFEKLRAALIDLRGKAEKAGLRPERAELLGGISRIPRVQELIKDVLRVPIGSRINGDEGMALGATLVSANATAGVRVQKIINNDRPDYGVALEVRRRDESAPSKNASLFEPAASRYGMRKLVTLDRPEEGVELTLRETPGDYVVRFAVTGIDAALARHAQRNITDQKLSLSFELDGVGVPQLRRAELLIKEMRTEPAEANRTDNATAEPRLVLHREALHTNKTSESPAALEDFPLRFAESKQLLKLIGERETHKKLLAERRNKLESMLYALRELGEEGSPFLTALEAQGYLHHAGELAKFLDSGEAGQATSEALAIRLRDVEVVFRPFNLRRSEHAEREKLLPRLEKYFAAANAAVRALNGTHPWVEQEKVTELLNRLADEENTLREQLKLQVAASLDTDPLFTADHVSGRLKVLDVLYRKLRATPRPKPADAKLPPNLDELMKNLNLTREQIDELMKAPRANQTTEDVAPETSPDASQSETPEEETPLPPTAEL